MKAIRFIGSLLLLLLQMALLHAQTISPAEINTAGGSTTTPVSGMNLDYTIGNPFQTAVVTLAIGPSTAGARQAQEADLASLPQEIKTEILASKAGLKAWPIPSQGPVTLALEGVTEPVEAQVLDQTGKLVQQITLTPQDNHALQLPGPGIFFIRTSNKDIPTLRLINR